MCKPNMKIALAGSIALGLVACGSFAGKDDGSGSSPAAVKMRTGQVDPRSGKPGAPVTMRYRLPAEISPGATVDVNLRFTSSSRQGTLQIRITGSDNVVVAGEREAAFQLGNGDEFELHTRVATQAAGLYYLNVLAVEIAPDGRQTSRALAVPVQVGEQALRKARDNRLETDAQGQPILVLPAEETQ